VFGKANSSAINLSAIADASTPLGGFVIHGENKLHFDAMMMMMTDLDQIRMLGWIFSAMTANVQAISIIISKLSKIIIYLRMLFIFFLNVHFINTIELLCLTILITLFPSL
jgi:hypothetical protein